jgi:1-acyl-sn-glycerol-3-phosphate acyltransferase
VAKRELADIPLFGWALRNAGHIVIDRSNPAQALATMRDAKGLMAGGVSVVVFPEGTRETHDHELLPLKKGGFVLALETGTPIVPVAVRGSRAVLASNDWCIHDGEIEVVVGAPIDMTGRDRATLTAAVHAFLSNELDGELPAQDRRAAEAR